MNKQRGRSTQLWRCPICELEVLAKPSANLRCGTCDEQLATVKKITISDALAEPAVEHQEIQITPEMVAAAESYAWNALSGRERFLSESSVLLLLESALEAGGFVVRGHLSTNK